MAAVLAAILAAFLAGAIALYRERRLEARRLRVSARVMETTLVTAMAGLRAAAKTGGWNIIDQAPGRDAFRCTWEDHRETLAGHLSRQDWNQIQRAVRDYLLEFARERQNASDRPPAKERLEEKAEKLDAAIKVLTPFCS